MKNKKPLAIFTFGKPLSGKTTLSRKILDRYPGFVYLNSDDARRKLFVAPNVYDSEQNVAAFAELKRVMMESLQEGKGVIYDVTNSIKEERVADVELARKFGAEVVYLDFDISSDVLEERRQNRNCEDGAIIITKEELEGWTHDPLDKDEAQVIKIDGDKLIESEKVLFDFIRECSWPG